MQIEEENITSLEIKYIKILLLQPFLHLRFYFSFHIISAFEVILLCMDSSLVGCI